MTTTLTSLVLDAPAALRFLPASRLLLVLASLVRVLVRAVRGRQPSRVATAPAAPGERPLRAPSPAHATSSVRPCQLVLF